MKFRMGIVIFVVAAMSASAQTSQTSTPQSKPAQPAQAVAPSSAAAPVHTIDPAKEADIRKLFLVMGSRQAAVQARDSTTEALRSNFTRRLPSDDTSKKFIALFVAKFRSKMNPDDLVTQTIPIYDKYLTDDDVKGLIQFYQSPLGQRVLKVMPQLSADVRQEGYDHGREMAEESLTEVLAEHPELKQASPAPSGPGKP